MHALEAGDDRDLAVVLETLDQLRPIHIQDAGGAMRIVGDDRQLPTLPGSRVDTHAFEHDREQPRSHLLAGSNDCVILAGIVQHGCLPAPFDQLVGDACHGGDHDGDFMTGIDLALDVAGHVADAVEIGDGRSAKFHYQPSHSVPGRAKGANKWPAQSVRGPSAGPKRRVYIPVGCGNRNIGAGIPPLCRRTRG